MAEQHFASITSEPVEMVYCEYPTCRKEMPPVEGKTAKRSPLHSTSSGKVYLLCDSCFARKSNSMTTIVRQPPPSIVQASTTALTGRMHSAQTAERPSTSAVDFDGIRSGVNLAHRADINRPPVQAIGEGFALNNGPLAPYSSTSSSMPPPALPQRLQPWSEAGGFVSGASTLNFRPQNWHASDLNGLRVSSQAQPGYTANHRHYKASHQANAARAYASSKSSFENIIINADLCRPTNEHSTKHVTVLGIEVALEVPAQITGQDLFQCLFDAIHTKFLKATQTSLSGHEFHLLRDDLVLKTKQKMDVLENYATESFMYKSCFKGTRFQANQKFDLHFHMKYAKWEELERAIDECAMRNNQQLPTSAQQPASPRKRRAPDCDDTDSNQSLLSPPRPKRHRPQPFPTSSYQATPTNPTFEAPTENQVAQAIRQQADSSKSCASALMEIGKATHCIQYFPFPVLSWGELIAYTTSGSKRLDLSNLGSSKAGFLVVDVQSSLGRGAMKTCNPGCIMLENSSTNHVALKRPYAKGAHPKQILRYEVKSELTQVVNEGLTLLCATSLLELAQSFVRNSLLTANIPYTLPLFPDLRFVQGGLALILRPGESDQSSGSSSGKSSAGSYLVEERIEVSRSRPWIKLINNSYARPTPAVLPHSPEMALAIFLQFVQHLQWKLTHGLAFVSDFQGSGNLLSDPQIMTHPSLGSDLFSGGNVGSLFAKFPEQHTCNDYCKWYKLGGVQAPPTEVPAPVQSVPPTQLPTHRSASKDNEDNASVAPGSELDGVVQLIG